MLDTHDRNRGLPSATPDVLTLLDRLSARLIPCSSARNTLDAVLEATLSLHDTRLGNAQLLDSGKRVLEIAVQSGFSDGFLHTFRTVSSTDDSACGRALRERRPILIADVNTDAEYAPMRDIAAKAGYRAVQSTPLITSEGDLIGVLSTHFPEPRLPSDMAMVLTRLYARLAADKIALLTA